MDQYKIGKFILEMRKERGLTQQDLADKLNVTDKAVSKWENGKSLPDVSIFENLSKILGVSIEELLLGRKTDGKKENTELTISTLKYAEEQIKNKNRIIKSMVIAVLIAFVIFVGDNLSYYFGRIKYYYGGELTTKLVESNMKENMLINYADLLEDYYSIEYSDEDIHKLAIFLIKSYIPHSKSLNYLIDLQKLEDKEVLDKYMNNLETTLKSSTTTNKTNYQSMAYNDFLDRVNFRTSDIQTDFKLEMETDIEEFLENLVMFFLYVIPTYFMFSVRYKNKKQYFKSILKYGISLLILILSFILVYSFVLFLFDTDIVVNGINNLWLYQQDNNYFELYDTEFLIAMVQFFTLGIIGNIIVNTFIYFKNKRSKKLNA